MTDETVSERRWQWKTATPPQRFHASVEMFWRGLGYDLHWQGEELAGHRDLDGQKREFHLEVHGVEPNVTEVRCRVTFEGTPSTERPEEVYRPSALVGLLGDALSRGFGRPAVEA